MPVQKYMVYLCLMTAYVLVSPSLGVLLRFRIINIAAVGDLEKAFLQISLEILKILILIILMGMSLKDFGLHVFCSV